MATTRGLTPLEAVNTIRHDNNGQVVLVLQGGGALGAYQGGVYQALHESGIEPDWIIGTSIGAINASIIAGNAVEQRLSRLQEFWRRVQRSTFWGAFPAWTGVADALSSWTTLTSGIPGFFEVNTRAFPGVQVPLDADHAGYYSTEPLRKTLEELVDFSLINEGHPRLTLGAAHVRTGMMRYFESREMELGPPGGRRERLAPCVVERDDPRAGLDQPVLVQRGGPRLAGLHPLIAREYQRLGLGVLLLPEQAGAELAAGVERKPHIG